MGPLFYLVIFLSLGRPVSAQGPLIRLAPARMPRTATVDPRFLSYNIEMVEVTGGRFWKPYSVSVDGSDAGKAVAPTANPNGGLDPSLFEYRPPIDLRNPRLRNLAKALGPAYVRVSGSWANRTYFQNDDRPPLKHAPDGFDDVLTRQEWKGVIDFARVAGAQIVTSFAISAGTRGPDGMWNSTQAKEFLDYTKLMGGRIVAAEFVNEPNLAARQGAPAGYDAAAVAKDMNVFRPFLRSQSPATLLVGPGVVGTSTASEEILKVTGPIYDVLSYHFYGAVSRRCASLGRRQITLQGVLSPEWLDRTNQDAAFYGAQRDTYLPGKPVWVTETAEASCGGDTFASQFADTFRFVNQFGALARRGVQVVMHNTLAASDYALIDEQTIEPRPNYWAAVLWKRVMGTTVLDPSDAGDTGIRIYAHCMDKVRGGVALLALNTQQEEGALEIPLPGERFTLTARSLTSTTVLLNGLELKARPDGTLPPIHGESFKAEKVRLPALSITFATIPSAHNSNCE